MMHALLLLPFIIFKYMPMLLKSIITTPLPKNT